MPVAEIHLIEGYSDTEKSRLAQAVTEAIRYVVPAAQEAVTVITHEHPSANYMRGGSHRTPAPALPDPVEIIRDYLSAMERRDLDTARAYLAEGFTMQFPASEPMTRLEELIAWSKPRYQSVAKTYDGFEGFHKDNVAVVYARGTLSGVWLDGSAFEGIRFIDRFELEGGKITRQDVWNDMAEEKAKT